MSAKVNKELFIHIYTAILNMLLSHTEFDLIYNYMAGQCSKSNSMFESQVKIAVGHLDLLTVA